MNGGIGDSFTNHIMYRGIINPLISPKYKRYFQTMLHSAEYLDNKIKYISAPLAGRRHKAV